MRASPGARELNVTIRLSSIARPARSPAQQAIVATEYYPSANAHQLAVRRFLLGYILQDFETDAEHQMPPDDQLLVHDAYKFPESFAINS